MLRASTFIDISTLHPLTGGLFCVKLCQVLFGALLKQMMENKNSVIAYVNDIHLHNVVRFLLVSLCSFPFYFVFSLNRFEE